MTLLAARLRDIRHVALDMDGTVYRGRVMFDWTHPFLDRLDRLGIGYSFLTNNSSRSTQDHIEHLHGTGIRIAADQIITSALPTLHYLREEHPDVQRLFVLGTESLVREIVEHGFDVVDDHPEAVVVGFDDGLTHERLSRAAYWITRGLPYVATHPDRICPTDQPTVLIDCGAICACLESATGIAPEAVLGKPDPRMLLIVLERHGLTPASLALVGDRIYTDIEMAHRAGAFGVLVLSGEATRADAEASSAAIDLVVPSLKEFGEELERARQRG
jgi:NagD protein